MKLEPLPLPHPTTFFMHASFAQTIKFKKFFKLCIILSVVMRLNFNQFFIFFSALYKLLHVLAEFLSTHAHSSPFPLLHQTVSSHPKLSAHHSWNPLSLPAADTLHCPSGDSSSHSPHSNAAEIWGGEDRGDERVRKREKWRDGRREWREGGGSAVCSHQASCLTNNLSMFTKTSCTLNSSNISHGALDKLS